MYLNKRLIKEGMRIFVYGLILLVIFCIALCFDTASVLNEEIKEIENIENATIHIIE